MSIAAAAQARRAAAPPLLPATIVVLAGAAALPVLLVKTPIMVDFFNHLGRIYAIAHLDGDPLLAQFYSVEWRLIPNLAMDAILPPVARAVGIFAAGKLFVLMTMALMLSGPFAISAALYRRLTPWPLVGFLFVYNWIFLYGFINYLFGVGLALWAIAAWIAMRDGPALRRGLVSLALALLLFASHLYALGLYGLALLCYEAWRLAAQGPPPRGRRAAALAAFGLPFLVALALLALSPTSGYASQTVWRLPEKLDGLYFTIKTYWAPADLAFGLLVALALGWAAATRRLRLHPAGRVLLPAGLLVFLAMPTKLFGSGIADMRLPIAILFILVGMARWDMPDRRMRAAFCLGIAALALLRFAEIGYFWRGYDSVVAAVERSLAEIAPGSRVLVAGSHDQPANFTRRVTLEHMPCLAMIERSSLVSTAFTHPGKQVLQVAAPYREIALHESEPPDIKALLAGGAALAGDDAVWADWRQEFDYVYVLYAEGAPLGPAQDLAPLYQGPGFALYRIGGRK